MAESEMRKTGNNSENDQAQFVLERDFDEKGSIYIRQTIFRSMIYRHYNVI